MKQALEEHSEPHLLRAARPRRPGRGWRCLPPGLLCALVAPITCCVATAGASTAAADTVRPPSVTAVSPVRGPSLGGTRVTVLGAGFTGATAVDFAQTPATAFSVTQTGTQITAISTGCDTDSVDVTVTVGTVTSATVAADQFTM